MVGDVKVTDCLKVLGIDGRIKMRLIVQVYGMGRRAA
jgi:hypothetical protein